MIVQDNPQALILIFVMPLYSEYNKETIWVGEPEIWISFASQLFAPRHLDHLKSRE